MLSLVVISIIPLPLPVSNLGFPSNFEKAAAIRVGPIFVKQNADLAP